MTSTEADSPVFRFLQRHVVEVLTLLYFVVLLYVTLLPFDFDAETPQLEPAGTWWGLVIVKPVAPDVASNVALYLPLGLLVCATLVKWGLGKSVSIVLTILFAAALSYGSEYSQRFSPSRICSVSDFLANLTGVAGGSLISGTLGWLGRRVVRANRRDLRERPSAVLARVVASALVVAALVPFDVTFSRNRFVTAVKNPHLVPFERLQTLASRIEPAAREGDWNAYYAARRDCWMLRMDYVAQAVGYAVLAVLTAYYLRRHCKTSIRRTATWTVTACSILAVAAAAGQLFIRSRGFDVTYIVVGPAGAMLGIVLYSPLVRGWTPQARTHHETDLRSRKALLVVAVACIAVFIALRETAPFQPVTTTDFIERQTAGADRLPMETYFQARLPIATEDLLRKLIRFALLGIAVALWRTTPPNRRSARPWATGFVVAGAVVGFEFLQLYLPSRVPAVTDVLLALFGTAGGVEAYRLAIAHYDEVRHVSAGRPVEPIGYDVEFGPPEEGPPERVPGRAIARCCPRRR